jgi:hypothetical protein
MSSTPKIMKSFADLTLYLNANSIKDVYLFIGNGARLQYKELNKVCDSLKPIVKGFKKPWLAAFGGDSCIEDRPDLGAVMKRLKDEFQMPLLAVQCWKEFDSHIDLVYQYPRVEYEENKSLSWGGLTKEGKIVGATAIYLSDEWMKNDEFTITVVNVGSKGRVGTQEIAYARSQNLRMLEIEAEPRNTYDVLSL